MVLLHDKMLGVRYPGGRPSSGYIGDMSGGDDEDSDQKCVLELAKLERRGPQSR
jgi:hypothetical protein